jgi:uncharacterized protein
MTTNMPNAKKKKEALDSYVKLVESLPELNCKGLCQESCECIAGCVTPLELLLMDEDAGGHVDLSASSTQACPHLTSAGRCGVHASRPLICRLWGGIDDDFMRCPYGCTPTRWISDEEARSIFNRAIDISCQFFGVKRTHN